MPTMDIDRVRISGLVSDIEHELRRIGYATYHPPAAPRPGEPFAGMTFEVWLQHVFLPAVRDAIATGSFAKVPNYRVGLAALRQYDYHTCIPEAHPLMDLCYALEKALAPHLD